MDIRGLRLRAKIWVERDGRFVLGEGGLQLLQGIARLGSLAEAAREIGWSYRHAWGYLRRAERVLGLPLTRTKSGKGPARGMLLTATGRALLAQLVHLPGRIRASLPLVGHSRKGAGTAVAARRGARKVRSRPEHQA